MVERALETASTLETSFGDSLGLSEGASLLGGFVAYVRTIRCGVYIDRRSRDARGVRVLHVAYVLTHRCGSNRIDHLAAGSIFEC
jgi:hypothetical protein